MQNCSIMNCSFVDITEPQMHPKAPMACTVHVTYATTQVAFTLERLWTKMVQINTILIYHLHINDENARGKRSLQICSWRWILAKTVLHFLHINGKTIVWLRMAALLPTYVHVVSRGLQSHDRHVLVLSHRFWGYPLSVYESDVCRHVKDAVQERFKNGRFQTRSSVNTTSKYLC